MFFLIKLIKVSNNSLQHRIEKLKKVDEIHIQIDILKNSDQGVEVLKEKFGFYLLNKE